MHLTRCRCVIEDSESGPAAAKYLRNLADLIDKKKIAHVSVSVHPKPKAKK